MTDHQRWTQGAMYCDLTRQNCAECDNFPMFHQYGQKRLIRDDGDLPYKCHMPRAIAELKRQGKELPPQKVREWLADVRFQQNEALQAAIAEDWRA